MAVKNYDTVNGQLIGECSSGVTTTYLTDEFGSAVETVQSGSVVNRYLYSPYGLLTSNEGFGSDPRFMWKGASDYRTTLRSYSEYLSNHKHYSSATARWTSSTPSGRFQNSYQFGQSNPVASPNNSPVIIKRHSIEGSCIATGCGDFGVAFYFTVDGFDNGWLIQHVRRDVSAVTCMGDPVYDCCGSCEFYEAWRVIDGEVQVRQSGCIGWTAPNGINVEDRWGVKNGGCTIGGASLFGELSFLKVNDTPGDIPKGWNNPPNQCSGCLPSTNKLTTPVQPWTNQLTVSSTPWNCCQPNICKNQVPRCSCVEECGTWTSDPPLLACKGGM